MPLVLPDKHPFKGSGGAPKGEPLRVGIVNIMPKMEAYEPLLLGPLSRVSAAVEPVFIRLGTHAYNSSDHGHLERFYKPFDQAPLDGLILTGAPVEELEFTDVHYWPELTELLEHARTNITSTLGLCWGGMALGGLLGIPKVLFPKKLFGVFDNRRLAAANPVIGTQAASFPCAHSRHSGIDDAALERAASEGKVRLLSHAPETGYSMFETPDHRWVAHLGHPEYVAERISFEWDRDKSLGRTDVSPPANFDTEHPKTTWEAHRENLFESWTKLLSAAR